MRGGSAQEGRDLMDTTGLYNPPAKRALRFAEEDSWAASKKEVTKDPPPPPAEEPPPSEEPLTAYTQPPVEEFSNAEVENENKELKEAYNNWFKLGLGRRVNSPQHNELLRLIKKYDAKYSKFLYLFPKGFPVSPIWKKTEPYQHLT